MRLVEKVLAGRADTKNGESKRYKMTARYIVTIEETLSERQQVKKCSISW